MKKILVIKLRHIGDVLLSTPVFRALRETFPAASLSALVNSGTEDVLRDHPLIDEILVLDRRIKGLSQAKRYMRELDFLREVRKRAFDMTIDLTGGDRAAILSFSSGARYRLGWRPRKGFPGKRYLYTHLSEPDGKAHMVLQNLEVLSPLGINTGNPIVDFAIPEEDRAQVRRILAERGVTESTPVVHVHPTSRWLFKCWEDEYMALVIDWLVGRGMAVIVTSSPDKRELNKAEQILSSVSSGPAAGGSRLIDLSGKTTMKHLGAISASSSLFFGVDSAPMHIAAAVGTPVVALFGPSGAFNWGPWDNDQDVRYMSQESGVRSQESEKAPYPKRSGIQRFGRHTVIQSDWDCIPCGKDGCSGSKTSRCLQEIGPSTVIAVLEEKLIEMRG